MGAVDFSEWAAPGLELTVGGRTYTVPSPTVAAASQCMAAAAMLEVRLGLARSLSDEDAAIIEAVRAEDHVGLGPVWVELNDDGVSAVTIARMQDYAVFYWARGREYADAIAGALWGQGEPDGGEAAPKD